MPLAPIVLFVYNRPDHTRRTLEALAKNELADQSILIIYADGPKVSADRDQLEKIEAVRKVIREKKWCREVLIRESSENKGLANSIITGVTEVVNDHKRVIVLEDDIVTAPVFLRYMNECLERYQHEDQVLSICSFNYFALSERIPEFFFCYVSDCWGWATWARSWSLFDADAGKLHREILQKGLADEFDVQKAYNYTEMLKAVQNGDVDSWAIRWYASGFLNNKLSLYPKRSLVRNIGFDGSGMNSGFNDYSEGQQKLPKEYSLENPPVVNNKAALEEFKTYFSGKQRNSFLKRVISKIKK